MLLSLVAFFTSRKTYTAKFRQKGLITSYLEDEEFAMQMKMLPSLAFVPVNVVIDCFLRLMADSPYSAIDIAEYFEVN